MRLWLFISVMLSVAVSAQESRVSSVVVPVITETSFEMALEARLLALQAPDGEAVSAPAASPVASAVTGFYQQRDFKPVWLEPARLQELIDALDGLSADGLDPEDYSVSFLRQMHDLLRAGQRPVVSEGVEWELLASNAYLRALYHLYKGKVDPAGLDPQWNFELHELSPTTVAELMGKGVGSMRIHELFAQARPQHPAYAYLQAGLSRYREYAKQGGWFALPAGPTLKPCMVDPQVALLRERLRVTGEYQAVSAEHQAQRAAKCLTAAATAQAASSASPDAHNALDPAITDELGTQLAEDGTSANGQPAAADDSAQSSSSEPAINNDEVFDEDLVAAVKQFQRDQYLEDDGAIGPATRAALNISVHARVDQIRVNLDRARWLLHNMPEDLLLVDIAGYKITYFKAGKEVWKSRVQVGMSYRTTPIFKSEVNYITLNPTWTVPPTILRKDILPKLRKDLNYLREHNIRVLDSQGNQLDPATINWNRPGNVTLRQDAGNDAALGKAVIRFPNPYAVYLHDTPHQKLFSKSQRAFSSGCIRVERALELVELLLDETPSWDASAIDKTLAAGKTRNVTLAKRIPIMLAYWTVDAVSEAKIGFKPDIYARDNAVLAGLNRRVSQPVMVFTAQ